MTRIPLEGGVALTVNRFPDGDRAVLLTVWKPNAGAEGVRIPKDLAEQLACALLQACGWDTQAMLAGPGGRAPVFIGELSPRKVGAR